MVSKAVRGATTVERDKKELILEAVKELVLQLIEKNRLSENQLVSIQFTVTPDLKSINPATALRSIGFSSVPLFCAVEPKIKGGLKRVIRLLITFNADEGASSIPVYLKRAALLRPDLVPRKEKASECSEA